jgi:hypothetical protein
MYIRIALAWLGVALCAAPSLADPVPLPKPRPPVGAKVVRASLPRVPLPPLRPLFGEPRKPWVQGEFQFAPGAPDTACPGLAEEQIVIADEGEVVSAAPGCGGPGLTKVLAIRLPDRKLVDLVPAAILRCETARAVARWVREDIAPAAAALAAPLKRIDVAASYHCRTRNGIPGAQLSEHGRANALDIRSLGLEDGRTIAIAAPGAAVGFLAEMRRGACERFSTVLGPGSDKAHALHLHVDLAQRRGGYRMCQWTMPAAPATAAR